MKIVLVMTKKLYLTYKNGTEHDVTNMSNCTSESFYT